LINTAKAFLKSARVVMLIVFVNILLALFSWALSPLTKSSPIFSGILSIVFFPLLTYALFYPAFKIERRNQLEVLHDIVIQILMIESGLLFTALFSSAVWNSAQKTDDMYQFNIKALFCSVGVLVLGVLLYGKRLIQFKKLEGQKIGNSQ